MRVDGYAAPAILPRRARRLRLRRLLAAADVLALGAALVATALMLGVEVSAGGAVLVTAGLGAWIAAADLRGLYDRDGTRYGHTTTDDIAELALLVFVLSYALSLGPLDRLSAAATVAVALGLLSAVLLGRGLARLLHSRLAGSPRRVLVVGAGRVGQQVARKLLRHAEYDVEVVGFADAEPRPRGPSLQQLPVLGPPAELEQLVERHAADSVIVAFSREPDASTLEQARSLVGKGVRVDVVPRLYQALGTELDGHAAEDVPLVGITRARMGIVALSVKRTLDLVLVIPALVIALPLFVLVAWRIKRGSPGPVLFRQTRLGRKERPFTMLKFRTLRSDTDDGDHRRYLKETMSADVEPGANDLYKLDYGDRVTPVGRWLRRTSLDELPQLLNVLRGDMSLVGPRPCIPYEVDEYAPHHFERFDVPAGITGLWQVRARARCTIAEALEMDVEYARSWSLRLDLSLLARTPLELIRQRTATT